MKYKSERISGDQLTFFNECQLARLLLNGSVEQRGRDHTPVACLEFKPLGYKWLITEIDPLNPDIGYGLINVEGQVNVGIINLHELDTLRGDTFSEFNENLHLLDDEELADMAVDIDNSFSGEFPLSVYYAVAKEKGCVVSTKKRKVYLSEHLKSSLN